MRVRITIADSNAAFAGVVSIVFLATVRVSMPAFNTAIVVELGSGSGVAPTTAQGSKVVMLRGRGGWSRWKVEGK